MAEAESLKTTAVKGVFWTMVENYSNQIVQFIVYIILARLLTPTEYGLIGMLAIFIGISAVFVDGGLSSALIQCQKRSPKDFSTVFIINVGMAVVMYTILVLTAPWIAEFYNQPILVPIVRIYGLNLIISSLVSTSKAKLTIELDFKTTTKITLISSVVSGIVGIVCAFAGCGVWSLVAQLLTQSTLSVFVTFYFVRWIPKEGFSRDSFHKLFSFSSKLFAATIISDVYDNITGAVIGKQFNAAALGFYTRAYQFNRFVNTAVTSVLGRVSYPLLSKIQNQDERLIDIYKKYIQMSAFLTFPLLMLLCGVAKPLILLLLSDKWADSVIMVQILAIGFMTDGVIVSNLNLIKVKGRSDYFLHLEIIKKAIAFSILGISILMDSVIAICIGKMIYGYVALYLNTIYTKRLLGYGFIEQVKDYWKYYLASIVLLVIALGISHFVTNSIAALFLAIPLSLGAYILICAKLKLYAYFQAREILMPVLRKINVFRKCCH